MLTEYCLCKHPQADHTGWENEPSGCKSTLILYDPSASVCNCCKFRLDNLKLIEDLAKQKSLV